MGFSVVVCLTKANALLAVTGTLALPGGGVVPEFATPGPSKTFKTISDERNAFYK